MNSEKGFMISVITGWNVFHQRLHQNMSEGAFINKKNNNSMNMNVEVKSTRSLFTGQSMFRSSCLKELEILGEIQHTGELKMIQSRWFRNLTGEGWVSL